MSDGLNLTGLRYAKAVAEAASFSAAARAHGVTQPALSNGIATLEERLGGRLFDRSPRGVTPTTFGVRILPQISRALDELDAVVAEARRLTEPAGDGIRMGVSPLIDPGLVARAFAVVREFPEPRDLVLREANMTDLRADLVAGTLDVILIPSVMPLPRYKHRVIDAEPVVLVDVTTDAREPAPLDEASRSPLILVPDACGLTTFTTELFSDHDLPLNRYPGEAASYRVLEQWAGLGLGAAILPVSKLSSPDVPHRRLRDDDTEIEIFYEAVWHPASRLAGDLDILTRGLAESTSRSATVSHNVSL